MKVDFSKEIEQVSSEFIAISNDKNAFKKESFFAIQALTKNDYLANIARSNPNSLRFAVLNIANLGLTLNPVHGLAYLVPRDGQVMLEPSYKGLVSFALETGFVDQIFAESVREKDDFKFHGKDKAPSHNFDPFSDRGELRGFYALVKFSNGTILCEVMGMAEINAIRMRNPAEKKGVHSPWKSDFEAMAKKTVIRRSLNLVPKSMSDKFKKIIEIESEVNPVDYSEPLASEFQKKEISLMLTNISRTETQFLAFLEGIIKRKATIEDLTEIEAKKAIDELLKIQASLSKKSITVENKSQKVEEPSISEMMKDHEF